MDPSTILCYKLAQKPMWVIRQIRFLTRKLKPMLKSIKKNTNISDHLLQKSYKKFARYLKMVIIHGWLRLFLNKATYTSNRIRRRSQSIEDEPTIRRRTTNNVPCEQVECILSRSSTASNFFFFHSVSPSLGLVNVFQYRHSTSITHAYSIEIKSDSTGIC